MKTVKNIVFRLLRKLIFSFFLISVLFAVFGIQKIKAQKAQIVGLEKESKAQLIKNLEEQIDLQKTQLDTIKTNLESLKVQISKDEESNKTINAQKEFRSQMAADKEQIKAPVVEFLAQQPEFSSDKEIVDKFSGAKKAMEKHEQGFISKIEVKEEPEKTSAPTEVAAPVAEPAKPSEPEAQEAVKEVQKPAEPASIEPVVTEQAMPTAPAEPQPAVEEVKPVEPEQVAVSPEVQTISKEKPQMPISQPAQEVAMPKEQKAEEVAKTPEFQPATIPAQSEPVALPVEKAE